jgi:hypothetical protein
VCKTRKRKANHFPEVLAAWNRVGLCVCETRKRKANHFQVVLAADSGTVV